MKKLIIGDPHGNYESLRNIIKIADLEKNDKIIFVGDYVDHFKHLGGNVKDLISDIIDLKKKYDVYTLIGNHDWWFREWLIKENQWPPKIWYTQGGNITLESYGILFDTYDANKNKIPIEHKNFFVNELIPFYIDEDFVIVHGGFTQLHQMEWIINDEKNMFFNYPQTLNEIMWDRSFYKNFDEKNILNKKYKELFSSRMFICGHTPYGPEYRSLNGLRKLLIDGGSKGGGKLIAALFESDNIENFKIIKEEDKLVKILS